MRKILFRGKTLENGQFYGRDSWITGYLFQPLSSITECKSCFCLICYTDGVDEYLKVTNCGQYIGIDDSNGQRCFEGDIVRFIDDGVEVFAVVSYDECNLQFVFETKFTLYTLSDIPSTFVNGKEERFTIIGNIYDNPNLLNFIVDKEFLK